MVERDRRAFPRYRVGSGTYVIYVEGSGAIKDLSLGGLFARDSDPLPVGTKLSLELHFRNQRLPAEGVVRRSVPGEGMGIEFTSISPDAKERLRKYLAETEASGQKPQK